jgi:hypothetical protein
VSHAAQFNAALLAFLALAPRDVGTGPVELPATG